MCNSYLGNDNFDSCNKSPARVPEAITTGATSVDDTTWWASNHGPCVDLYAPGDRVLSTQPGESTAVFSGTSMACPHVAGAVARHLGSLGTEEVTDAVEVSTDVLCCDILVHVKCHDYLNQIIMSCSSHVLLLYSRFLHG